MIRCEDGNDAVAGYAYGAVAGVVGNHSFSSGRHAEPPPFLQLLGIDFGYSSSLLLLRGSRQNALVNAAGVGCGVCGALLQQEWEQMVRKSSCCQQ